MKRLYRLVRPAALTMILGSFLCVAAEAQTIGDAMVGYLNGKQSQRVGSGRSTDMATEALRVGGGEFDPVDLGANHSDGDRVWGTLVTTIKADNGAVLDTYPDSACQPGDVMQFGGSAAIGDVSYPFRFTAVIRTVDSTNFRPTSLFRQNFGGDRTVQTAELDVSQLSNGWVRVYRPLARTDVLGTWKFTLVNNSATSQTYTIMNGIDVVSTVTAEPAGTNGSYRVFRVTTEAIVPCVVVEDNTLYVETAKGNEIFDTGIRQLTDPDQ